MINLIPKEERKKITVDFYCKLGALFLAAIDLCLLVALASLLPAYFVSSVKDNAINARLEAQKEESLPTLDQKTLTSIKDINDELALIEESQKSEFSPSLKVVNAIVLNKRPDIKITQILYENDATMGKRINITGTAPSREVLLLFSQALASSPSFTKVNLPISNFIKGSNIQFSLSLIPS